MCANSGAMGVRRVRSHTENEPPHETEMALWRTSDLGMGRCVCSLDDVHGPVEHERPTSSSLQGPCALILGQPPSLSRLSLQRPRVSRGQPFPTSPALCRCASILGSMIISRSRSSIPSAANLPKPPSAYHG